MGWMGGRFGLCEAGRRRKQKGEEKPTIRKETFPQQNGIDTPAGQGATPFGENQKNVSYGPICFCFFHLRTKNNMMKDVSIRILKNDNIHCVQP